MEAYTHNFTSHPRYVRLYKTPPPKLRMDNTTEEQARILLLVLVQRHWKHHGPFITPFFEQLGALQHKVLAQVWGKHSVSGNGRLCRVGRRGRGARLTRGAARQGRKLENRWLLRFRCLLLLQRVLGPQVSGWLCCCGAVCGCEEEHLHPHASSCSIKWHIPLLVEATGCCIVLG